MLFFISVAETVRTAIESIPPVGLLFAAPVAIITLATVAIAIATFIDSQLPAADHH